LKPIDFFSNPEYALVILTSTELRFYVGDNVQLELIEALDVSEDALPQRPVLRSVVAHRSLVELKRFALHLLQVPRLARLPVVVAGDDHFVSAFVRFFQHPYGVITYTATDLTTLTCPQILKSADAFREKVREVYATHFQDRLRTQMRAGRVLSDVRELARAAEQGSISRLLLSQAPAPASVEHELAAIVIREGGKVQLIPGQLFPVDIQVLGVLRGELHAHSPLFAMDA
jgi:hypothetical protein